VSARKLCWCLLPSDSQQSAVKKSRNEKNIEILRFCFGVADLYYFAVAWSEESEVSRRVSFYTLFFFPFLLAGVKMKYNTRSTKIPQEGWPSLRHLGEAGRKPLAAAPSQRPLTATASPSTAQQVRKSAFLFPHQDRLSLSQQLNKTHKSAASRPCFCPHNPVPRRLRSAGLHKVGFF